MEWEPLNPYQAPICVEQVAAAEVIRTTPWQYVGRSVLTTLGAFLIFSALMTTRGVPAEFAIPALLSPAICTWGFCRCPRRARFPKLLLLLLMVPNIAMAEFVWMGVIFK